MLTRTHRAPSAPSAAIRVVSNIIQSVRGKRVIFAADLAPLYGVTTKALNQAVRRNRRRFPPDFAFRLTKREATATQRSRSQSVTLKRGANLKYLPMVFTEHGAVMVATVLNSSRAVRMSVFVVRAFLMLRNWASIHADISLRLRTIERRVGTHDEKIKAIVAVLQQSFAPTEAPRRRVGFLLPATR